ncbi:MAG: hemerythrin domain-containing protein [Thermoplasmata archaeon]
MSLKENIDFKGSIATQSLRNQHIETVDIAEGYLAGKVSETDFVAHINSLLSYHFRIEEEILYPAFKPYLEKYLPYMEPIKMVLAEHNGIRNLLKKANEGIERTQNLHSIAELLLQHVYKEENGVFKQIDQYMPDSVKEKIEKKISEFMDKNRT